MKKNSALLILINNITINKFFKIIVWSLFYSSIFIFLAQRLFKKQVSLFFENANPLLSIRGISILIFLLSSCVIILFDLTSDRIIELYKNICQKAYELLKKRFVLLILITAYMGLILFFLHASYHINDNIGILYDIESNQVNYLISMAFQKFLFYLYHAGNIVPWYGLSLYLVQFCSLYLLIGSLIKLDRFKLFFPPFILIYLGFFTYFVTGVDYTITSILICGSSLFAFMVYLHESRVSVIRVILLGLLFSLSYHIRINGADAVIIFTLPVIILFFLAGMPVKKKRNLFKYFLIFLIPFLFTYTTDKIVKRYNVCELQKQYDDFNALRGKIHDFPILGENMNNREILQKNNWSENDYKIFIGWIYFDENKYNVQTMSNILTFSVKTNHSINFVNFFNGFYSALVSFCVENKWEIMFVLLTAFFLLYEFNPVTTCFTLAYLFYIIAVSLFFCIFLRFPRRLALPLILTSNVFIIYIIVYLSKIPNLKFRMSFLNKNFINKQDPGNERKKNIKALLFFCLFSLPVFIGSALKIEDDQRIKKSEMNMLMQDIEYLNHNYKNCVFLHQPCSLRLEFLNPLELNKMDFTLLPTGWGIFSPRFYQALNSIGLKRGCELIPYLVKNSNCYFICPKANIIQESENKKILISFIRETYDLDCDLIAVDSLKSGCAIYKASRINKSVKPGFDLFNVKSDAF